jgi:hypothetical protein
MQALPITQESSPMPPCSNSLILPYSLDVLFLEFQKNEIK